MPDTIYTLLTKEFNQGRLRAILSSGQAVVLHRLAITSKDGDWIIRPDEESTRWILGRLESRGASYRFGAPLSRSWLESGWSSHFEFMTEALRVRTDFVSRPPRVDDTGLDALWSNLIARPVPFVDAATLARLKMTMREKDYPIIGELARIMTHPEDQALYSRSARDLMALAEEHPAAVRSTIPRRPLLGLLDRGREAVETALDEERRSMIRADEKRMNAYAEAASDWRREWPETLRLTERLPLGEAHAVIESRARNLLPAVVNW